MKLAVPAVSALAMSRTGEVKGDAFVAMHGSWNRDTIWQVGKAE